MIKLNQVAFDMAKPMPPFIWGLRVANRKNLKTQTRRVMKPQPNLCFESREAYHQYSSTLGDWIHWNLVIAEGNGFVNEHGDPYPCPYGCATDFRYMREPLYRGFGDVAYYQDDDVMVRSVLTGEAITWKWKVNVLSQLYMPKEAARTFKRYEFIRAERLQKISEADAVAEGVDYAPEAPASLDHRTAFAGLWNKLNFERDFPWSSNMWVWVIGYRDALEDIRNAS
jgi:hypothetical protein